VSPRRNRPKGGEKPTESESRTERGDRFGLQGTESWQGEEWSIRHVAGASAAGKRYRCPGCDQEIPPGVGHVVAWPAEGGGPEDRRHWHRPCWDHRLHRMPNIQRSRRGPRY
jgi:hypothetical protein